ncbi:colanic acid exporter, partial [Klebsiella pneumoniae]|nr:colanic acid exporter [Klebsiella pneumoniae]
SLSGSPLITLVIQIIVGIVTFSMTLIFSNNQFVSEMKCYIVKNPKIRKFIRA